MTDELIEQLARQGRDAKPPRAWDDVLEGRRSAEEVAVQRQARGDDPEEVRALMHASTPLEASERAAWVARLRAGVRASGDEADGADEAGPSDEADEADQSDQDQDQEDRTVVRLEPAAIERSTERSRWRRGIVVGVAAMLATAAAVALWMRPREVDPTVDPAGVAVALPAYSLEVRDDSVHPMRGDPSARDPEPAAYRLDSEVHWMIRPRTPVDGAVELGVVLEDHDDRLCLHRPSVTRASDDGIFEVRGTVKDALGLSPGPWRLHFLVAGAGTLGPAAARPRCEHPQGLPCACSVSAPVPSGGAVNDLRAVAQDPRWRLLPAHEIRVEL
ncbi:MAG: hypothetical protein AAGF11_44620 [Myxococcota bacterium]